MRLLVGGAAGRIDLIWCAGGIVRITVTVVLSTDIDALFALLHKTQLVLVEKSEQRKIKARCKSWLVNQSPVSLWEMKGNHSAVPTTDT